MSNPASLPYFHKDSNECLSLSASEFNQSDLSLESILLAFNHLSEISCREVFLHPKPFSDRCQSASLKSSDSAMWRPFQH